jgi:plastocyanin
MKPHELIQFRSISRWLLMLALAIAPTSVRAQSWQATVSAQSRDKGMQALAFLPNEIWVHAGDTVTWNFAADSVHTVTFLTPNQPRPTAKDGCPGSTPDGAPFDGSSCVNGGRMTNGQNYTVTFPAPGNFELVCLVHPNMTGVVHVLDPSMPLSHDQAFYDHLATSERKDILSDTDAGNNHHAHSHGKEVTAGTGEIVATAGGSQTVSLMRFLQPTQIVHVGDTVEWTNDSPVEPHTITFGTEPQDLIDPSANVSVDVDGARHAEISSRTDNVHSGFIVAAPQERIGLVQAPLGVTRFRVTFTHAGSFPYICALHDQLGMKGKVIVVSQDTPINPGVPINPGRPIDVDGDGQ